MDHKDVLNVNMGVIIEQYRDKVHELTDENLTLKAYIRQLQKSTTESETDSKDSK